MPSNIHQFGCLFHRLNLLPKLHTDPHWFTPFWILAYKYFCMGRSLWSNPVTKSFAKLWLSTLYSSLHLNCLKFYDYLSFPNCCLTFYWNGEVVKAPVNKSRTEVGGYPDFITHNINRIVYSPRLVLFHWWIFSKVV